MTCHKYLAKPASTGTSGGQRDRLRRQALGARRHDSGSAVRARRLARPQAPRARRSYGGHT
jgi:hypothetical protein